MILNWSLVASAAMEQNARPMLLADGDGVIRGANRAAEQTLGALRSAMIGRSLTTVLRPASQDPAAEDECFRAILQSPKRLHRCLVTNLLARNQVLAVDAEAIGDGTQQGALITIHSVLTERDHLGVDVELELDVRGERFGVLHRVSVMGSDLESTTFSGRRCHELLHQRKRPCEACPLLQSDGRVGARASAWSTERGGEHYLLVSEKPSPNVQRAIVQERPMNGELLRLALRGMLRDVGRRAQLSEREVQVLDGLACGRSFQSIGESLQISPRTVKFHQANLLQKLGLPSRRDLLSLLLEQRATTPRP